MSSSLDSAFVEAIDLIENKSNLVRVVLSGRRRNFSPKFERIDIRPVSIKDEIKYQVVESDGRQNFTKNLDFKELELSELLNTGYANILVESKSGTFSLRITKKGEPLIHRDNREHLQNLEHDKKKVRLLDPSDPFLIEVGISDEKGAIKPSRQDKYIQVEEFLRILTPTIEAAISSGQLRKPTKDQPLRLFDLGCGNAYLTFAAHQYLNKVNIPTHVTGIDIRPQSLEHNQKIAQMLGITSSIEFKAESIHKTSAQSCDIAVALHACDTATDDAIAWAVSHDATLLFIAPCCHHDLQTQMVDSPKPWSVVTKYGLLKERLGDLLTDSLRAQILKLKGYRTEVIEFTASDHTPRNIMIRATHTKASPSAEDLSNYKDLCEMWGLEPALAQKLDL